MIRGTHLAGALVWPPVMTHSTTVPFNGTTLVDATTEYWGALLEIPPSWGGEVVRTLGFYITTKGAGTTEVWEVAIETVSSSGGTPIPTGTRYATNSYGTIVHSGTTQGAWNTVTLVADCTLTAGDVVAVVARPQSGVPALTFGSCQVVSPIIGGSGSGFLSNTGSAAFSAVAQPKLYLKNAAGNYLKKHPWFLNGVEDAISTTYYPDSNGTYPIVGNKFYLPFECYASGIFCCHDANNSGDSAINLYSINGTLIAAGKPIATGSVHKVTSGVIPTHSYFSRYVRLMPGWYVASVTAGGTTADALGNVGFVDADARAASHEDVVLTTASTPGTWTDVTTRVCNISLIVAEIVTPGPLVRSL